MTVIIGLYPPFRFVQQIRYNPFKLDKRAFVTIETEVYLSA
jgi:hypothetical protein